MSDNIPIAEQERIPTMLLLGGAGVGKSSFGNHVLERLGCPPNTFKAEAGGASVTTITTLHPAADGTLIVGDVPGLGDPEGEAEDIAHLTDMVTTLRREAGHVNCFVLVFNSETPRLDARLKEQLHLFRAMFGPGFFGSAVLLFTHWGTDRAAQRHVET